MPQNRIDAAERAAECEHAILRATDPKHKAALSILRELWLAIADQVSALSDAQLADIIAVTEKLHANTLELGKTSTP